MLFVDKHRPTSLSKLDYHTEQAEQLRSLVASGDLPHVLFYGPSGAGKKTRLTALLREVYGTGVEKVRVEHRTFKTPSNATVEISSLASNWHIELNPSDAGLYDRQVVQEVVKEIASSQSLDASSFKVVVLNEVDMLSKQAQHALRRTMEKYMSSCRLLLVATSLSKVIEPIRSRCFAVRVAAPSRQQVIDVLDKVARKEGMMLPPVFAARVADASNRNLRRALLMLEASMAAQYPLKDDQAIERADWELYVADMARIILQSQSPQSLVEVRGRLYELLTHCIPPGVVLQSLTLHLLRTVDASQTHDIVKCAAFYDERMQAGSKPIFHLEAFVAKVMTLYKRYLEEAMGM